MKHDVYIVVCTKKKITYEKTDIMYANIHRDWKEAHDEAIKIQSMFDIRRTLPDLEIPDRFPDWMQSIPEDFRYTYVVSRIPLLTKEDKNQISPEKERKFTV